MIKMGKLKRAFVFVTIYYIFGSDGIRLVIVGRRKHYLSWFCLVADCNGWYFNGVLTYYKSDDNKTWTVLKQTRDAKSADDMDDKPYVYYYVQDMTTKIVSNVITVKRNDNSVVCGKTCHISSTGEYYSGTDFDPVDPSKASSAKFRQMSSIILMKMESAVLRLEG